MLRLDPESAPGHAHLGSALAATGDLAGALESLRAATALEPARLWIQSALADAERLVADHARLVAVLRGENLPTDAGTWRALAEVAYRTRDYAASVRCWRETFRSDADRTIAPGMGHLYEAACAAVLAGAGSHDQALEWLRAELRSWQERPETDAEAVAGVLRKWTSDPNLAAVRDADGLADEWRTFWQDVDALLALVSGTSKGR